ncbi:LegC family aminotransferase [Lunatibacter salilacus]|uniref:LegC family aminotransferase n=1 Tax=Lunatibacter salilacus TaxID=2483804 RepID=UPI00131E3535|nr:LegC family aminotransferase [Lunatibacter salilacus]
MNKFQEIISFIKSIYPEKDFIPLHEPKFLGNEKKYLCDAIDSTFVSSVGAYVNKFEEMIAEIAGTQYAVATVNGTSALHMAMLVAGVKRDDLVITQSLTFIATCNAISYIGAEPVFLDVDRSSAGLSPESLEHWLKNNTYLKTDKDIGKLNCYHHLTNKRVAAVVPMHTFGHPVMIEEIVNICENYGIPVVEDAAESLGSSYRGRQTGGFGLLGTFSFNGNKTVTCGGGGAIVTNDGDMAKKAKHLTTQAKVPHQWEFIHDEIGYNYRMPNLNAALACAQLEQLQKLITDKRAIAETYKAFFSDKAYHYFDEPPNSRSNFWLNAVLFSDKKERDEFLAISNAAQVMTRPVWRPMHQLPMFKEFLKDGLENTNYLADRLVNIPSSARF